MNQNRLLNMMKNKKEIYIFGAGKRGLEMLDYLESEGIPIKGFVDNNHEIVGSEIMNHKVYSLELVSPGNALFIVTPIDNKDIFVQLESYGAKNVLSYNEVLYFYPRNCFVDDYDSVLPFNHYESPYADLREIHAEEANIFKKNRTIFDIDFNLDRQLQMLSFMKKKNLPAWTQSKSEKYRYYYNNSMFGKGSADVLSFMMQMICPHRIIEIGSGFSTAVMLDTREEYFNNDIEIICIEPRPKRLHSLLREDDDIVIFDKDLQKMDYGLFESLGENDILFIDSSHVAKVNGDVNYELFEILPRLHKHVYIHFHDAFYPFEYPAKWIYEGRAYNELYLLRAFLMNNNRYSIQFFGEMIKTLYPEKVTDFMDLHGSLWIRKE